MTAMIHRLRRRPAPRPVHVGRVARRREGRGTRGDGLLPGWRWSCSCASWGEDANWRRVDACAGFATHVERRTGGDR